MPIQKDNCIKVKEGWFKITYVYLDTRPYASDQIFINHRIKVSFKKEMRNINDKEDKYRLVFCKIKKEDEEVFLECMEELYNKMLLREDTYYAYTCVRLENILKEFGGIKNGRRKKTD